MKRPHLANSSTEDPGSSKETERVPTAREVLLDLFLLLEDYAPTWYTEEHHNRAVAALNHSSKDNPA